MPEDKFPPPVQPLNYARPGVRRTRPILGAIAIASSVVVGLVSLIAIGVGIYGMVVMFITRPKDTGDSISGDLIPTIIFLIIGSVGGYVSIRWLKSAAGMLRGK